MVEGENKLQAVLFLCVQAGRKKRSQGKEERMKKGRRKEVRAKEGRKDKGRKKGKKERRKESRKKGRKEGRQAGRQETVPKEQLGTGRLSSDLYTDINIYTSTPYFFFSNF